MLYTPRHFQVSLHQGRRARYRRTPGNYVRYMATREGASASLLISRNSL